MKKKLLIFSLTLLLVVVGLSAQRRHSFNNRNIMELRKYLWEERLIMPLHSKTSGLPSVVKKTYTFGDEMNEFVRDSAYIFVMRQLPVEYASRSLNGFQVTMDKARKSANKGTDSLTLVSPRLKAIIEKTEPLILKISLGGVINKDESAQLASYATELNAISIPLAEAFEQVRAHRRVLHTLDGPLNLTEFRNEGLHLVPLTYVRSAFGGAPDFNSSISVSVTVYNEGGGAAEQNGVQGGFFLLDMWEQEKKMKEYLSQMEIYHKAFERLPEVMPPDTLCYRLYLEGFKASEKIYGEEPSKLFSYMDTLQLTLSSVYSKTMALKRLIDNTLLLDRVDAVYKTISIQNFSAPDQQRIRQKAFEINQALSRLIEIRSRVESDKSRKIANFIAAEQVSTIASQVLSQIAQLDSLPLFLPLHPYLPSQQKWFKVQKEWAKLYLAGTSSPAGKPKGAKIPIKQAEKPISNKKKESVAVELIMVRKFDNGGYPELSLSYNWPRSGASQPHESAYENGGMAVWARNSDGAYARDLRAGGGFMVGHAKRNMNNRIRETSKNHTEAVSQATINYPVRIAEIGNQRNYVVNIESNLSAGFSSIPLPTLPSPSVSVPIAPVAVGEPINLDVMSWQQRFLNEQKRSDEMVRDESGNLSPGLEEYIELHNDYSMYAQGLYQAGYQQQANLLLEAATGMRAERLGFLEPGQAYPALSSPNIPFEPFTVLDYKTVSSRNGVYELTDSNMGTRSRWFAAAAMVTGPTTLGIADLIPKGESIFSAPLDFMRAGNEELFPLNMANAAKILSGTLTESFTTPTGERVSFSGLQGKALDYALVLYEQTQVENFIKKYSMQHPEVNMYRVMGTISYALRYSPIVPEEVSQAMPLNFDFSDFEHRVKLGQRLIDIIYAKKPLLND